MTVLADIKACENKLSALDKWVVAGALGLLFALLSNPIAYQISNYPLSRVSEQLRTVHGKHSDVTPIGLVLHAVVYMLIIRALLSV